MEHDVEDEEDEEDGDSAQVTVHSIVTIKCLLIYVYA